MKHIVYKTTNQINGRYYIGKHSQPSEEFDGYLGSGHLIKEAISKYGSENFTRETLYLFEDETECYLKEYEIVSGVLDDPLCYNLREGGMGFTTTDNPKLNGNVGENNPMFGKTHSESAKEKMRVAKLGHKFNVGVPFTEERKQNISKALKGLEYDRHPCGKSTKQTYWWNDGTKHKRSAQSPGTHWVKGRINKGNLGGNRVKV